MNYVPIIKGITQAGKYALNQRVQKREQMQQLELDQLKEQAWKKRLWEETRAQEQLKQYMLAEEQIRQQEMTKREAMQQARLFEQHKDDFALDQAKNKVAQDRLRAQTEGGYFKKYPPRHATGGKSSGGVTKDVDDIGKKLKELQDLRRTYMGGNEGQGIRVTV